MADEHGSTAHECGVAKDVVWMAVAVLVFVLLFRSARDRGLLLQVGE